MHLKRVEIKKRELKEELELPKEDQNKDKIKRLKESIKRNKDIARKVRHSIKRRKKGKKNKKYINRKNPYLKI